MGSYRWMAPLFRKNSEERGFNKGSRPYNPLHFEPFFSNRGLFPFKEPYQSIMEMIQLKVDDKDDKDDKDETTIDHNRVQFRSETGVLAGMCTCMRAYARMRP